MKQKHVAIIIAIISLIIFLLILSFVIKQSDDSNGSVLIHGEVIDKFLDSFVVKTQYTSDNQVFYVFRVEKSTEIIDGNGNPIRLSDVQIGSEIEIALSDYAFDYIYEERHELLPSQIVLR